MTNMVKRAFPGLDDKGRGLQCIDDGMSLRDWFAGQALAALVREDPGYRQGDNPRSWEAGLANCAYRFADAMMKARDAG